MPSSVARAETAAAPHEVTETQAFEIFDRIARVLIATTDLKTALASLMDEAVALTGAEYGGYFYNDRDKQGDDAWELFALSGADEVLFKPLGKPRITPLFSPTYMGEGIIRSDDIYDDPRYGALGGLPTGHIPLRSYLAVPVLRADGRVHGAMLFGHSQIGRFSPRIETIIASIASLSQVALERSQHVLRLEHEVRERKRVEKRFSDLIEHSPRMKWWRSTAPDTETTFFNAAWRDFTGLENAPGLRWTALIHPAEREYVTKMRAQKMAEGMSYGAEFRLRGRDGHYRWLSAMVSPIRDIDGKITDWVGTATDITDRREAEARLSENNRLLTDIINASPDPIFVKGLDGRHLLINTATSKAMGLPVEEILGRSMNDLVPSGFGDRIQDGDRRALAGDANRQDEVLPIDGREVVFETLKTPLRNGQGDVIGIVGVARDITERRNQEMALRESEERFLVATRTAGIGVWEYDLTTGHIIWTEEQARLYGVTLADFDGTYADFERFVIPEDRQKTGARFEQAIANRDIEYEFRFRVRHADGGIRFIRAFGRVHYDEAGKAVRIIGSNTDETAEVTARKAVLESERRLKATHDNAGVGICEIDEGGHYLRVNETFATLSDLTVDALKGMSVLEQIEDPLDRTETQAKFEALVHGDIETFECVRRYTNVGGRVWWADCRMTAVTDEQDRFLYAVRVVQDVTEARKAQDQERLLLAELTHRVKNTIATIQSLATQTLRTAGTPEEFNQSFHGRLHAIAATHSLLIQTNWTGATLGDVLSLELAPYHLGKNRFALTGPEVHLNPSAAVNMGLVLHELITNAVKYGALSAHGTGGLAVAWDVVPGENPGDEERLLLNWSERGGPPVTAPKRKGFGTRLFRSIASQFMGAVDVAYDPAGVQAVIDIPMTTIKRFDNEGPHSY